MNTPRMVPMMLVMAAKISLFHDLRNARWAISRTISPVNDAMAKIIPVTSRSLGGTVVYLIFLFSFLLRIATFLVNSFLNSCFKVYPAVVLSWTSQ